MVPTSMPPNGHRCVAARVHKVLCVGALVLGGMAMAGCGVGDSCRNATRLTVLDSSGRLKAVVFRRSCGTRPTVYTGVSVLPVDATLLEESTLFHPTLGGNALVLDGDVAISSPGHPAQLTVTWHGPVLDLRYDSALTRGPYAGWVNGTTVTHRQGFDASER